MKRTKNTLIGSALISLLFSISVAAGNSDDTVLKFYLGKVDSALNQYYLFESNAVFSTKITARLYETNYRGIVTDSNIAVFKLDRLADKSDTVTVIKPADNKKNVIPGSFNLFRPWKETYRFYFFPNDTGAGELAIGFDPSSEGGRNLPGGLFSINRDDYFIKTLIFYFPNKKGYKKYSESYQFGSLNGFITLQQIEINGARATLTGIEYFKQVVEFNNYQLRQR